MGMGCLPARVGAVEGKERPCVEESRQVPGSDDGVPTPKVETDVSRTTTVSAQWGPTGALVPSSLTRHHRLTKQNQKKSFHFHEKFKWFHLSAGFLLCVFDDS